MNPVLLTVIREAYYTSKTSIARQTYLLYLKYPSLKRDMKYMGFNWASALPKNAFVMGAVAVSPSSQVAVQCWPVLTTMYLGQTGTQGVGGGTFCMLTWGSSARSRFARIGNAIATKAGNRAYYRRLSQEAGQKYVDMLISFSLPIPDKLSIVGGTKNSILDMSPWLLVCPGQGHHQMAGLTMMSQLAMIDLII